MNKAQRINEVETSRISLDPEFQAQERDNLITYYEGKLREVPKDAEHAEERAALEQMIADARKMLRGEEL